MGSIVSDIFGGSQPAAPAYVDPTAAAKAQGAANVETAIKQGFINNPNVYSPAGSQLVTFDPETNQPTVRQTLTPTAQTTFDTQQRVQQLLAKLGETGATTAQDVLNKPFAATGTAAGPLQTRLDLSNLAQMPVNAGMTGQQAIMARLEPQLQRQQAAIENQLANQGITPGSEAYRTAQTQAAQNRNDLLSQAALQGISLDTGARAQGFNEQQSQMAAQNAADLQERSRQLSERQGPLNEITGLLSGSQIQMPQFQGYQGAQVAPAPIFAGAQAANQNAMNQYGIQSANANAQNQGLYNLLGQGGMAAATYFSDRRLKSKIERIGTHRLGIGIYEYDIFGGRQVGVMADEVEAVMPEAVIQHPSGYKMVNYGALA
jgi:hypothetical protein